eukprot:UN24802
MWEFFWRLYNYFGVFRTWGTILYNLKTKMIITIINLKNK